MNTLHQLRCGGVLEAVRISCAGYPTKSPYADFVDHFWNLGPELLAREELDDIAIAEALLAKTGLEVRAPLSWMWADFAQPCWPHWTTSPSRRRCSPRPASTCSFRNPRSECL